MTINRVGTATRFSPSCVLSRSPTEGTQHHEQRVLHSPSPSPTPRLSPPRTDGPTGVFPIILSHINTHWMYTMIDGWPWFVSLASRPPILVSLLCRSGGWHLPRLASHGATNRIRAGIASFNPFIDFVESIHSYFCSFRLFQHGKSPLVPKHLLLLPRSTS